MATIIASVNEKGGVLKTSSTVNLAWALADMGHRVLTVDVDVQSHTTSALAAPGAIDSHPSLMDIIRGEQPVRSAIRKTRHPNVDQLVGSRTMANAEIELYQRHQRPAEVLKAFLAEVSADYAYIIIDCPPSLNRITMNAMVAADTILCPVDGSFYALDSFRKILSNLALLKKSGLIGDPTVRVLFTLWNPRTTMAADIKADLEANHPTIKLFRETIPSLQVGRVAPAFGQTVFEFPGKDAARIAAAYVNIARELVTDNAVEATPV